MALPLQKFREIVFQIIFCKDLRSLTQEEIVPIIMRELKVSKKSVEKAFAKAELIEKHFSEIDLKISESLIDYTLDRVAKIEKAILRLGFYELLLDSEVPAEVAIAEAVRLAKKFGTPSSVQFVNAVLDNGYKRSANFIPKKQESEGS